jgi:hypothetical protein
VRSLRGRLVAAIGIVALVSVAVAVAIGAAVTRRAVERNTLKDVGAQAELLAGRQSEFRPGCTAIGAAQRFAERQNELLECIDVGAQTPYLTPAERATLRAGRPVDGTVTVDGRRLFRAARPVQGGKAFLLLRPTSSISSSWRPQLEGLLVGAL